MTLAGTQPRRIVLGVGGGIAAYKACEVLRRLTEAGHRVRDGVDYPAVLFTTFESDTRVDPLHARKLAAALQHATSGGAPIVLRREISVGHGARAISRTVGLAADQLAFLGVHTGLTPR